MKEDFLLHGISPLLVSEVDGGHHRKHTGTFPWNGGGMQCLL